MIHPIFMFRRYLYPIKRYKYRLIHGHFHICLVIIPRPILALDCVSGQYGGLGMITRPIWKCPCINLYLCHPCSSCRPSHFDFSALTLVILCQTFWTFYTMLLVTIHITSAELYSYIKSRIFCLHFSYFILNSFAQMFWIFA